MNQTPPGVAQAAPSSPANPPTVDDPTAVRPVALPSYTPTPTQAPKESGGRWVAVLIVVVVVAVGGFAIGRFTNQPAVSSPAPVPSSSAAPSSSAPSASVPVDPQDTVKPSDITVTGTVAPGLWKSTATVASGNSGEFMGVRVGWPRTLDGAIGAAMSYMATGTLLATYLDGPCQKLERRILTGDTFQQAASTPEFLAKRRKLYNLNDQGQPLGPDGKVDVTRRFYGGGEPRYGAVQVLKVTDDETGAPMEVHLMAFMPQWAGVGTDTDISGVKLYFRRAEIVMQYLKGTDGILDWRMASSPSGDNLTLSDMTRSNPGYPVLRAALGPGWVVPADSTQEPLPGALMSK